MGDNYVELDELREFSQSITTEVDKLSDNPTMKAGTEAATETSERYTDKYGNYVESQYEEMGDTVVWSPLSEAQTFWSGLHSSAVGYLGTFLNQGQQSLLAIGLAGGSAVVAYQSTDELSADDIRNSVFVPNGLRKENTLERHVWEETNDGDYPDADNDGYADSGNLDTDGDGTLDTDDEDIDGDDIDNDADTDRDGDGIANDDDPDPDKPATT